MRKCVFVAGKWDEVETHNLLLAAEVGRFLASVNSIVVTGGGGGVMEAVCKGAKENGGMTVGFLAGFNADEDSNDYLDIVIPTGMGYEIRSALAIRMCEVGLIIGGGNGTLGELSMMYLLGKKIFIFDNCSGIGGRVKKILYQGSYLDGRKNVDIIYVKNVDEFINKFLEVNNG